MTAFVSDLVETIEVLGFLTHVLISWFLVIEDNCKEQPAQLDPTGIYQGRDMLEPCTPLQHYDYFSGSEISFALTFLVTALSIPGKHL